MSLRDIQNQRGVTVYDPRGRFAPPPVQRPVQRAAPRPTGDPQFDRQKALVAQASTPKDEEDEGSPFGRGLGFLINNPVTQTLLKPLEIMDYGRRAVTLGMEEFAEGITGQELKATEDDDRSNMEKLKDPTYGVGQLLGDLTGNKWIDRSIGLVGDIAFDPLSYVTAGVGAVAGKGARSSSLAVLREAQETAARNGDTALVKALGGAGREGEATVQRLGKRGLGVANPAQTEAMGLRRGGIRLSTPLGAKQMQNPIPGTERLARGVNDVIGRARTPARKMPGAKALRGTRNPIGFMGNDMGLALEKIITGEGPGTLDGALATVALDDAAREVGNTWGGYASQTLERTVGDLKKKGMSIEQITDLARRAEAGETNEWSRVGAEMRQIAEEMFGVVLPEMEGGTYIMPHVLNRKFRNGLMDAAKNGDASARAFMDATGLREVDLTEQSGFLQRRAMKPNPDGSPKEVDFAGRKVEIEEGTVEELNEKLRAVFPWFDGGDIYETNPILAYQRYISGVSRDVGQIGGGRRVAASSLNPNVRSQTQAPGRFDPYGATEDVFDAEGNLVPRIVPNEGALAEDEFWRAVPDKGATTARNKEIRSTQKGVLDNLSTYSEAERGEIARELETLADEVLAPMKQARSEASARTGALTRNNEELVDFYNETQGQIGDLATRQQELTTQIEMLAKVRYGIERTAKQRTARRQKRLLDDLAKRNEELITQRSNLEQNYRASLARRPDVDKVTETAMEEARAKVNARVEDARAELDGKLITLRRNFEATNDGPPPTPKQYEGAKRKVAEQPHQERGGVWVNGQFRNRPLTRDEKVVRRYENWQAIQEQELGPYRERLNQALREQGEYRRAAREVPAPKAAAEPSPPAARVDVLKSPEAKQLAADQKKLTGLQGKKIPALKKARDEVIGRLAAKVTPLHRRVDELTKQAAAETATPAQVRVANRKMASPKRKIEEATAAARPKIKAAEEALAAVQKEADELAASIAQRSDLSDSIAAARRSREMGDATAAKSRAEKVLASQEARQLIADRNKLADLQRRATTATGKAKAQLNKDIRVLRASLDGRSELAAKVDQATESIRVSNVRQAELARFDTPRSTGVEPTPPPDLQPVLDRRAAAENAGPQIEAAADKTFLPPIAAAEMEQAATAGQLGRIGAGADDEFNAIALDEGMEAIGKRQGVNAAQEQARFERTAAQQQAAELDEMTGGMVEQYKENLVDIEGSRLNHERIAADVRKGGATAFNPKQRTEELAGRKPTKAGLDRVVANEVQPAVEQPLYSVVEDIRRLIQANPNGDDELLSRIEAALTPLERRLSKLTTEADIPARQTDAILKAAKKGELAPVMRAELRRDWKELWSHGDVVISKELETIYKNLVRIDTEPSKFFRALTTYTNFFKTYATLTPGFHIRNGMSAVFMNYAMGVPSETQIAGLRLWRKFAKAETPLEFWRTATKQERDAISAVLSSGAGGRYFEAGVADVTQLSTRMQERLFANRFTKASQRFGQDAIEGPVRTSLALDALSKEGSDVRGAMQLIDRIQFDYSRVSEFDEKAKRLIPFWTFMSRNLPMQITTMWTHPRTYARYNSFIRNFKGEDVEGTPEYFGSIGAFPFADEKVAGMPLFLQPDFAHTRLDEDIKNIEDLLSGENVARPLTNMNPIFTAPIEFATGRDFFTGRSYDETDLREAGALEKPYEMIAALLGQTKTTPGGKRVVSEKFLDSMRSINPLYDRAVRLAPQVTTGGNEEDAMARQLESIARTLGAPTRTLSPQQQQSAMKAQMYDRRDEMALAKALAAFDR